MRNDSLVSMLVAVSLLACIALSSVAFAQVEQAWLARYDEPDQDDVAMALALDSEGNAYVTGSSVTVKYSASGEERWVKDWSGSEAAVDSEGNLYVTGSSEAPDGGWDYATVKCSPDGDLLWTRRYDGPAGDLDVPSALVLDSEGNAYVTGSSVGGSTGFDYATVKYSPEGEELWVARYDGPAGGHDFTGGLAVDSERNVYVTGRASCGDTGYDYATIKYSSAGEELWVTYYNGPAGGDDGAGHIAIDSEGNVYVTGNSEGIGTEDDYATVKYSLAGDNCWVARYNGPAGGDEMPSGLALDSDGNIYVTGYSVGLDTGVDYATVKYSPAGDELWVQRYDGLAGGNDLSPKLVLDSEGYLYVTGSSEGADTGWDYATVKYDPTGEGEELWVARYNGPADDADNAYALAVDGEGNVHVAGGSDWQVEENDSAYVTIKYVQTPVGSSFRRGDSNSDGGLDIADAIFTLSYLFTEAAAPSCFDGADANDDGNVDIADAIAVLSHLFAGADPLPEPFGGCGMDPTVDKLGCEAYLPCEERQ